MDIGKVNGWIIDGWMNEYWVVGLVNTWVSYEQLLTNIKLSLKAF